MHRRKKFILALWIAAAILAPIGWRVLSVQMRPHTLTTSGDAHAVVDSIQQGADLRVFRCLPRHDRLYDSAMLPEPSTLMQRGRTCFLPDPLPLSADDLAQLRKVLAGMPDWPMHSGKLCGAFHPDLMVEWHDRGTLCFVYLCLGCDEVQAYRGSGLWSDFSYRDIDKQWLGFFIGLLRSRREAFDPPVDNPDQRAMYSYEVREAMTKNPPPAATTQSLNAPGPP